MSKSRITLLAAVALLVAAAAVVALVLKRDRPREDALKPMPQTASPPTATTSGQPSERVAVTPASPTPSPTTFSTTTSTTSPATPPAPNEDGVALLPPVTPPAPAPAPAQAAGDAATFAAFAPGGRLLVARASGRLGFVDLATGQRQAIELTLPSPRAVAVSPAGDRIAVANAASADLWHVASSSKTRLAGGDVTALLFGRGGQLFTCHAGGELTIRDAPGWTSVATLKPKVGAVTRIAQSPATAHVAVIGAGGGGIAVCDAGGDRSVKQRLGADGAWSAIAFAPDGRTLAAAGPAGVAMWDTMLWQRRPAPGGTEPATDVAFWRGGTVLVTAGADGAIRIYDLATRQLMTTLSGRGPVVSLDLADDGRTIAATDASGVSIWDATTRASRRLDAHP
jgi:WD40 repeat protein